MNLDDNISRQKCVNHLNSKNIVSKENSFLFKCFLSGHNLRDITVFFSANSENLILSLFSVEKSKLFGDSSSDTHEMDTWVPATDY